MNFEAIAFSALGVWCLIWRPSCMPSLGTPSTWRRTIDQLMTDCSRLSMDGQPTIDGRQAGYRRTASWLPTDGQPTIDGRPADYRRTASQLVTDGCQPSGDGRLAIWWSSDSCLHSAHLFAQETNFFRCSNKFFGDLTFLSISAFSV